jgi:hypothetical protein
MIPTPKRPTPNSRAADRELIELAKTLDLTAIALQTGRPAERLLEVAKRLGLSIKGSKTIRR